MPEQLLDLGYSIPFSDIEKGMRELNSAVSFEAEVRRPSDYSLILRGGPKRQDNATGVYYNGHFVAPIDRGVVPEREVWSTREDFVSIPMTDAEKYDDSKVCYIQILPEDPFYNEALTKAELGHDNYVLDGEKLFRYEAFRMSRVPDRCVRYGWRQTFERMIAAGIPGITREAVARKFCVDLSLPGVDHDGRNQQLVHAAT